MSSSDNDLISKPSRSRTRTEDIRLQLADEIVKGELVPGTQLDEMGLAARFGVSRTPIREALRQLEASGLVEQKPHCGAFVAKLSPERLDEMFIVMAELEALCAGLAAVNMSADERRELEAILADLAGVMRQGDPQRYHELNEAFHNAIYAGSHNAYLAELTLATRLRLAPFRRAQFRTLGRLAKSQAEHTTIVETIARGDRAGAAELMRTHIDTVKISFDTYVEQQG
ncbi:GntR family transcriptional regulator [Breoghania sp.]|uniref:GntR family transcriptional regulator n=1 Tax=Breoghania sp. TaxID=2065378 RepID=UPI002AAB17C8|nr:GntR family transcriptional regulator [Breoghania sp.]